MTRAAAKNGLGSTRLTQVLKQSAREIVDILGAAGGERVLGSMPGSLAGVEVWSVGGQALQIQPQVPAQQLAHGIRIVDRGAIPQCDHLTARMTDQIPEEVMDFFLRDILRMHPKVKTQPPAFRAHRQPTGPREAITMVRSGERWESARRAPRYAALAESS